MYTVLGASELMLVVFKNTGGGVHVLSGDVGCVGPCFISACLLLLLLRCTLLGKQNGVDVGEDAARRDRDLAQQLA